MPFGPKTIEFPKKAADLTDKWLQEHKDHNPVFITQTEFKKGKGTKYQVCRCYWCRKVARKPMGFVNKRIVKKFEPEKNIQVSTFDAFERCE